MNSLHDKLVKIQTSLNVPKGHHNSFGNYKYRSCEDILEAVKPLLKITDTTITIIDEIVLIGDRYYIKATATLTDKDNETSVSAYAREAEIKKGMDVSQITGATSSYARKYALNGLFCIDDTKDADTPVNQEMPKPKGKKEVKDDSTSLLLNIVQLAKVKLKSEDGFKAWLKKNKLREDYLKATEEEQREIHKLLSAE